MRGMRGSGTHNPKAEEAPACGALIGGRKAVPRAALRRLHLPSLATPPWPGSLAAGVIGSCGEDPKP